MTVQWATVACPACAAQPDERCFDPEASLGQAFPVYLPTPHAERVEAAAFVAALGEPAQDRAQITNTEILATGEV